MSFNENCSNRSNRTLRLRATFNDQLRKAWINRQIARGSKLTATIAACVQGYPLAEKLYASRKKNFAEYRDIKIFALVEQFAEHADALSNPQARGHLAAMNALKDLAQAGFPQYAANQALLLHDHNRAESVICGKIAAMAGCGAAAYALALNERGKNPDLERKYLILAAAHQSSLASRDLSQAYAYPDSSGGVVKKQNIVLALWYASKALADFSVSSDSIMAELMPAAKRQGLRNRYPTVFKNMAKQIRLFQ